MSGLRWILLVLGVAIIATVYFIGRYKEQGSRKRHEPALGFDDKDGQTKTGAEILNKEESPAVESAADDLELLDFDDLVARGLETEVASYRPTAEVTDVEPERLTAHRENNDSMLLDQDLVVLNLFAAASEQFEGSELYSAMQQAGFLWTNDQLFHCQAGKGEYIALNALKPGIFPEDPSGFGTRAIALILQLPAVDSPVDALDEFLGLAKQLQSVLGARLCDGQRSSLTGQTISYLRDEVLQYQFKHR